MLTFVLTLPDEGVIVDSADSPRGLDFSRVAGQKRFEVSARVEEEYNNGGPLYPVAAVDLTGYEDQVGWVTGQLCEEIDFRRAFPGFEGEVKNADGPLITFGEPNIDSNGFIV